MNYPRVLGLVHTMRPSALRYEGINRCPVSAPDSVNPDPEKVQCVRSIGHGHIDHTTAAGASWPVTPPHCPFGQPLLCTGGCSDPLNRACVDGD